MVTTLCSNACELRGLSWKLQKPCINVLHQKYDNEDDQPPFVDSESEDEETRRWRRMRIYHKKRYEYSSLNHNLHFETTADSRGEEATLTVVEEVAVEEAMTEVIDEVLEEMTEVE
ncbi:hypothetical protein CAPTEDRAFT_203854 [Capitella teleta]|uniref:Uncharacterized protein n=1 Tax=Capitella teleta TaxID=283909 RepID=R7VHA5_CAPTE|nr:hypothetical protein CAPTEDRAFT_203854 [Capitella teleta]|eukprot:ELU18198.1 hypothetical protein CAPTEDRAFT_203854 [Capitella teleta]